MHGDDDEMNKQIWKKHLMMIQMIIFMKMKVKMKVKMKILTMMETWFLLTMTIWCLVNHVVKIV